MRKHCRTLKARGWNSNGLFPGLKRPDWTVVYRYDSRAAIEAALKETRGNRRKAAEILDIGERTLYRKLRDYGIAPEEVLAGSAH
jgi:DNA-binding NtrC family response regulator